MALKINSPAGGGDRGISPMDHSMQHPQFDQEDQENPGLSSVYGTQGPDVFGLAMNPYTTEVPDMSHMYHLATPNTSGILSFPTGTVQPDQIMGIEYSSPTHDEDPPSNTISIRLDAIIDGSGDSSIPAGQAEPQPIDASKALSDEEGDQERIVLRYSGGGAWKCAICAKSFRRRRRAVLHVLNKHNNIRIECNGACGTAGW
ncbi:hypothetical protein FRC17_006075 [Serendipita sp. 399]|nr:hypothetical protein FRC17_006075 [Serendipita sp. 399]